MDGIASLYKQNPIPHTYLLYAVIFVSLSAVIQDIFAPREEFVFFLLTALWYHVSQQPFFVPIVNVELDARELMRDKHGFLVCRLRNPCCL